MQNNICNARYSDRQEPEGVPSEGLGVLERQSQVRKDILPICIHAHDHALSSYSTIVITTLVVPVSLTDVAQHPRPCVCGEVLTEYTRRRREAYTGGVAAVEGAVRRHGGRFGFG